MFSLIDIYARCDMPKKFAPQRATIDLVGKSASSRKADLYTTKNAHQEVGVFRNLFSTVSP